MSRDKLHFWSEFELFKSVFYWSTFISNLDQNYKFEQVQDETKAYSNHVIINFGYVSGPKFTYQFFTGPEIIPRFTIADDRIRGSWISIWIFPSDRLILFVAPPVIYFWRFCIWYFPALATLITTRKLQNSEKIKFLKFSKF